MFNKQIYIVLLFIITFASLATKSYAQGFQPEMSVGLRGGANFSFMIIRPSINQGVLIGPNMGFMYRYISEKYFGFQVELDYIQKGWRETANGSHKYTRQLDYIEIPFMSHITFGNRLLRWFFNIGPNIAFMVNNQTSGFDWQNSDIPQLIDPIKNKVDYGICAGTGFEFNTKVVIYQLEARYNYGLGNIFASSATSPLGQSSNQNVSVNLALLFKVNKKR